MTAPISGPGVQQAAGGWQQMTGQTAPPTNAGAAPDALVEHDNTVALWMAAALSAAIGAAVCFDATPGINWGIWTIATAGGFLGFVRRTRGFIPLEVLLPVALACALAAGAALTADPFLEGWIIGADVFLLASAMLLASGRAVERFGAATIAIAPVVAGVRAAFEALRRAFELPRLLRAERAGAVLRGLLLAAPVVAGFALLLSGADPLFARARDALGDLLQHLTFVPRLVCFGALGALALGTYGSVLRPEAESIDAAPSPSGALRLGPTERTIITGAVASLFGVFLVLQFGYFFGNVASIPGTHVTYADYARHGFAELTVVASLATMLIVALDRVAVRGAGEGRVRWTSAALVVLVQLLLDSAFHRVRLYEDAYGFTTARVYAQAYMVVVTLALVTLGLEIWSGIDVRRLARRGALLGATALGALIVWNHQAWVAAQNIARAHARQQIDPWYLGRDLAPDAVPTIVAALPSLAPADAASLTQCLRERYTGDRAMRAPRWFEWSVRRAAARRALVSIGIEPSSGRSGRPTGAAPTCASGGD